MVDVIAIVADEIATLWDGRCYCHCGRWNSHIRWNDFIYGRCYCLCGRWNSHLVNCYFVNYCFNSIWVLWCWTETYPMYEADSIWLYFCSGMDCWPLCILILLSASWGFGHPPHYTEILRCRSMICGVIMVIYMGRGLKMFYKPLSKCSCWFFFVLFMAFHPVTLVSVYNAIPFGNMIFVLGCHQEVFDGPSLFKVNLYAMFIAYIFYASAVAFCVW